MGDHDDRAVGRAQLVDAARHGAQRVDVEPAVGLVEDREARLQHRHLEDLVALFLAAGKPDIDGALQQVLADVEQLQLGAHDAQKLAGIELGLAAMAALRIDRGAQEIGVVHARDLDRVLEGEKHALARPLVGRHREQVAAEIGDAALGDLVAVAPGQHRRERALARAVRPHDRVHLAARDREVDPFQDLAAVRRAARADFDFEHHRRTRAMTHASVVPR